jgi:hypothetical protein
MARSFSIRIPSNSFYFQNVNYKSKKLWLTHWQQIDIIDFIENVRKCSKMFENVRKCSKML